MLDDRSIVSHDVAAAVIASRGYDEIKQVAREGHAEHGRGLVWFCVTFPSDDATQFSPNPDDYSLAFINPADTEREETFRDMADPFYDDYDPATSLLLAIEWQIAGENSSKYATFVCPFASEDLTPLIEQLVETSERQQFNRDAFDRMIDEALRDIGGALPSAARDGYRKHGRGMVVVALKCDKESAVDDAGGAFMSWHLDHLTYAPKSAVASILDQDAGARAQEHIREYRPAREMVVMAMIVFPKHMAENVMLRFVRRPLKPVVTAAA